MNDYPLTPSKKTKTFAAFFFAFHYGMFHIVYASFLLFLFTRSLHTGDVFSILLGGFIFFINHLFSYIQNKDIDEKSPQNLGKVFIAPYARILPMHFILIIGATISEATLIIFLILKTLVDLIFHSFKHRPITR
ncbi:hypothetical protein HY407_01630 [Candidatus Gottesmanbacteria bacterium]|nr:hypothetical protein [Candidatus Gottesmanbacteria bacterium]